MRWRRTHRWLAVGALLLVIGFVVTWFVGKSLIAPANRIVGQPPKDLNVITTSLVSDSGSNLATWYIPAANSQATVILLHPIRGDRRSMLGRARLFHDAGYAVLLIDFQAHGESAGNHMTMGYLERYDVRAAVDYARKTNPSHRIGIVGWSLGGAATLLAGPLGVDAIVLESTYPTISDAVHDRIWMRVGPLSFVLAPILTTGLRLQAGISPSDLRPIDHIHEIGCPVLMLAGDSDRHTTLAETQRLFDAAAESKELVVFQGAAHVDLLEHDRSKYEASVLPFLAKHLLRQSDQASR